MNHSTSSNSSRFLTGSSFRALPSVASGGLIPIAGSEDPKNELIKASAAIQITNRLSLLQRKLGNALLKHAFNRLEDSETHSVNLTLLADKIGFDSKNVEVLKDALTNLAKTSVEFNLMGKDKRPIWGISTVLSQAIIRDGVLFYSYPPFMRRALRHPDIYAKLNLTVQNGFRSKHALALWEFFTDYLGSKREQCDTDFISIEQYRALLGVDPHDYQDFRDFNKRLIKHPIQEINEISDIQVDLPPRFFRSQRRIQAIRFHVVRRPQRMLDFDPPVEEPETSLNHSNLIERMKNLGFNTRSAQAALKNYAPDYIEANILVVENRISQGDIDSPAALLRAALRDDYRPVMSRSQWDNKQRIDEIQLERKRQTALKFLEQSFSNWSIDLTAQAYEMLSDAEKGPLQSDFLEHNRNETFLVQRMRQHGFQSPFIYRMFMVFCRDRLLPHPWQRSLDAYIEHMNQETNLDPELRRALDTWMS